MGGIFSPKVPAIKVPKPPPLPPTPRLPLPSDQQARFQGRAAKRSSRNRKGRLSTLLTSDDNTLG